MATLYMLNEVKVRKKFLYDFITYGFVNTFKIREGLSKPLYKITRGNRKFDHLLKEGGKKDKLLPFNKLLTDFIPDWESMTIYIGGKDKLLEIISNHDNRDENIYRYRDILFTLYTTRVSYMGNRPITNYTISISDGTRINVPNSIRRYKEVIISLLEKYLWDGTIDTRPFSVTTNIQQIYHEI